MDIKQRFAIRAAAMKVTAGEVAQKAEVTGLSGILAGKTDPRRSTLERIEEALGMPSGWLINDDDDATLAVQAATTALPLWVVARQERVYSESQEGESHEG